jgi:hypothetical protein
MLEWMTSAFQGVVEHNMASHKQGGCENVDSVEVAQKYDTYHHTLCFKVHFNMDETAMS